MLNSISSMRFSALQRAENSSICDAQLRLDARLHVSVLFSEPKIPQSTAALLLVSILLRFSALQRAENSSILLVDGERPVAALGFSALQRAENSSI